MPKYIVLLGPPGVGKGTQADILATTQGIKHISSGDLFRENIKAETALGVLAKSYIDKGELVPDDVTIGMIRERLKLPDCEKGAILDGFPRTPAQAEALEIMLSEFEGKVDVVPYITAEADVLIERACGRWTCRMGGHVYHQKFNPPKVTGVCDIDESDLYQRDDDTVETMGTRIRVYLESTAPLVEYYKQKGLVHELDGTKGIETIFRELLVICERI